METGGRTDGQKRQSVSILAPPSNFAASDMLWEHENKRAQRALGRSPEEKVKGHSGANNREPQGE